MERQARATLDQSTLSFCQALPDLPNDVWGLVFSHLPRYAYGILSRVCRKWRHVIAQPVNLQLPDELLIDPAFAGYLRLRAGSDPFWGAKSPQNGSELSKLALRSRLTQGQISLIVAMGYIDVLDIVLDDFMQIQLNTTSVVLKKSIDRPDGSVIQGNITYRIYQPNSCLYFYSHQHLQNIMLPRINNGVAERDVIFSGSFQEPGSYVMIEETYLVGLLTRLRPQLASEYCQYLQTLLSSPKEISPKRLPGEIMVTPPGSVRCRVARPCLRATYVGHNSPMTNMSSSPPQGQSEESITFQDIPSPHPSRLVTPIRMLYRALQENAQTPEPSYNYTCVAPVTPYLNNEQYRVSPLDRSCRCILV